MRVCLSCGATGKVACAVDASRLMYHTAIVSRTLSFFTSSTTLQQTHTLHTLATGTSRCLLASFHMQSTHSAITAIAVATSYIDKHILMDASEVSD